jgi:hypothetical protein
MNALKARNIGGLNAASRGTALLDRDQTLALSLVSAPGQGTLNEARIITSTRRGARRCRLSTCPRPRQTRARFNSVFGSRSKNCVWPIDEHESKEDVDEALHKTFDRHCVAQLL